MPRYRQIYNIFGLYAGRSPATGYHYFNYNNEPKNDSNLTIFDFNGLGQIDRVQSFNYGFQTSHTNLSHLGKRDLINRIIVNRPSVQVNFNYLMAGVRNEHRLGMIANFPDAAGEPTYDSEICCFKNFTGFQTDPRNLFLAIAPDNLDLNNRITDNITPSTLDPSTLFVFGFGNCYMNSYSIRASVGALPEASIGYICDNVQGYSSGSGCNIPAVYPKSGNIVTGPKFTIPHSRTVTSPSVILPKDITLQITQDSLVNTYDYIYLWNVQTSLYNKIELSGAVSNETLVISNGIGSPASNSYSGMYLQNVTDNSYNQLYTSGADGNQNLLVYSGITNPASNYFSYLYLKNVSTNNYTKLNTSGIFSGENIVIDPSSLATGIIVSYPTNAYFGVNSSGAPIQSFDMSIQLDREDLRSIGYVLPIDRRINFPIFADINLSTIVDNNTSDNLVDKLHENETYDLLINMYNPGCSRLSTREIAIQYKIKNAKFTKTEYSYNIGNNLVANFGFQAEIDVDNPSKGLFISGLYNADFPEYPYNYLVVENNRTGFLLMEDTSNPLIIFNTPE